MGIRMVRQPSETPNVTNIDDIIPFRYAYGNQDGYVIGKGTELSYTIDGSTFRINSGRVVLQGVETDIDANGVSFTIDNASETRYYSVYYEVNLATQTTAIKLSSYSTSGYPTIDAGDDLTVNSSGIARLELYRFTANSGIISNVKKVSKAIEYSGTALVGYDINKGTVEERLEKLGFKEGAIEFDSSLKIEDDSVRENYLHRQGNYVLGRLITRPIYRETIYAVILGKVPKEFLPKQEEEFIACYGYSQSGGLTSCNLKIDTDGNIFITNIDWVERLLPSFSVRIGYEAKPL